MPNPWKKVMRWILFATAIYSMLLIILIFLERAIVYPAPRSGHEIASIHGAEDVVFHSSDGTKLHGWYFELEGSTRTMLFFHGNAECVDYSGAWIGRFAKSLDASVFIFDYRGYGKSEGKPSEQLVVQDGVAAVDWLVKRTGKTPDQMIYFGRSLGGGVAIQVAIQRAPRAFLLVSTFSSITDVAASKFWMFPVRLIMRNQYQSEKTIAKMDIPLLQIHGDRDLMIPIRLGKRVHDASPSDHKSFVTAAGCGHNKFPFETFLPEIDEYFAELESEH